MNPYQIMGVIAVCASLFAGVVTLLAIQGVPILVAFICVYVVAIWFMLTMQRRARQAAEGIDHPHQRRSDRELNTWRFATPTNAVMMSEQEEQVERRFGA